MNPFRDFRRNLSPAHDPAVCPLASPTTPLPLLCTCEADATVLWHYHAAAGAGATTTTTLPTHHKSISLTLVRRIAAFKDSRQSFRTMAAKMVAADYNKDGKGDEVIAKWVPFSTTPYKSHPYPQLYASSGLFTKVRGRGRGGLLLRSAANSLAEGEHSLAL